MGPSLFDARWIWHPEWIEGVENSVGEFIHFRKSVTIKELQTTADTRYKLYINLCFVFRGLVKGDEHLWFYDELDIQPYLKASTSHIAVRVLRFYHATPLPQAS
jgi:hypothetical protein